ncbi:MAG: beta-hydroxyacyl-ACP dehydratase [Candidatus Aminicenantes bacterium]|nr:MAG: beta-hydroxyacyl-ACP dehydratase [Candidatus Aminicenantes bacterium]
MRYYLIDRIIEMEKNVRAKGIKNCSMTEDFFTEHFPQQPVMPGLLMMEGLVQLSSWLISYSTDFKKKGLLQNISVAKYWNLATPGDQLTLTTEIKNRKDGPDTEMDFKGTVKRDDQKIATAQFTLRVVDLEIYESETGARKIFSILINEIEGSRQ